MKEKLEIVYLNKSYQDYIVKYCSKHQFFDKGDSKKPFVGVVVQGLNGNNYFAPLTSADRNKYIEQIDMHGLNKGKSGIINFNLMIPVPNDMLTRFDIKSLPNCDYKRYLTTQARYLQRDRKEIQRKAAEVYVQSIYNRESKLSERCNDFLALEKKALAWEKEKTQGKTKSSTTKKESENKSVDVSSETKLEQFRNTKAYQLAVEKYGQKRADKLVDELLSKKLVEGDKKATSKTTQKETKSSKSKPVGEIKTVTKTVTKTQKVSSK